MTNGKKRIRVFLAFLAALTVCFLAASGAKAEDFLSPSPYGESIKNYNAAYRAMYLAMYNLESELDLSELKIRDSEIIHIYSDIRNNSPELFYLQNSLTYYYNNTGSITSVKFSYTMSNEEILAARLRYDEELAYIVSLTDSAMTDLETALFLHDYFVSSFSYDDAMEIYDAYGLLTTRRGVCQAYSLAYAAALRERGIDAVMVTSEEMNHAWNLVKIDGSWYHVDLSYDDPSPDRLGMVLHENFLLSDDAIRENHSGWGSTLRCRSTLYDNAYWKLLNSRMIWIDGSWYYIDDSEEALITSDYTGHNKVSLYQFTDKWYVSRESGSFWKGIFSGCANFQHNIYFNTPNEVMVYSILSEEISTMTKNTDQRTDYYGLVIYKNTLEFLTADQPDNPYLADIHIYPLTEFDYHNINATLPFEDVPRLSKYYPAVRFVYNNHIFNGVSETEFSPDTGMTRGMFVTVLGRLCGVDPTAYETSDFTDVPSDAWYAPYVAWAAEHEITSGVGEGKFAPDEVVTHEQMYKLLYDTARYLGLVKEEPENVPMLYVDRKQISDWAYSGISYCHKNDLIDEDFHAYLKPKKAASRGTVAELLFRFASSAQVYQR